MKKICSLLLVVLMISCILTACGTKEKATDSPAKDVATEENGTKNTDNSLQYIKDNGKFVLGLDASFPPMGYKDEDDNIVGFDIDLAKEVCKRMGVELKLQPINWTAKEQELTTKNIDCIWNGLSYSEERAEAMTLSQAYMNNNQVVVVLKDSDIKVVADLAGKIVAIQNGSTASDAMDEHKEVTDTLKQLVKVDDNVQAMMDLKIGGSDAVVMDEVVALYYMEKDPDAYRVIDGSLAAEQYVIGFRKGDDALKNEVEKCLKEMKEDGTLAKICTTWFGKDVNTIQ
ncbi:MAG: amino acid ABC transporter substrate-binding protein [Clostridiales bacterium]|nr:amino acid ABC transporter substrate-binding protein [Clostridiales bacterium]